MRTSSIIDNNIIIWLYNCFIEKVNNIILIIIKRTYFKDLYIALDIL